MSDLQSSSARLPAAGDRPTTTLQLGDFEARHESYASNPWRIFHRPSGDFVSIPRSLVNGDGKTVSFRGPACFPTKRDALAWMRDELPALLAEHNSPAPDSLAAVRSSDGRET